MRVSMDIAKISVRRLEDYGSIQACVEKGFDSLSNVKLDSGSSVVIKPNLCAIKSPETGTTTDVRVIEAIVDCLESTFGVNDISIIESDGTQVLADLAFRLLGYEKLSTQRNVQLVNLSKAPFSTKEFPNNRVLKRVKVPKIIEEADLFISVPKIKTHSDCFMSCALKNQYGCNPYWHKSIYHKHLHESIVDLNLVFRPDFTVVDGIIAMEGCKGPTDGIPVKMNTLLFGRDPVAIDHLVARIMGINPGRVDYIRSAENRGIGTTHYVVEGATIQSLKRKFKNQPPRLRNLYGLFSLE
jgi:uncharacterized protein (DUF362 family)